MKVYITGVAGFLGSHLASVFIDKGYKVAGCDNYIGGYPDNCPKGVDFICESILSIDSIRNHMQDSDLVIHTAALAYEGLSVFSPKLITENIYAGTMSVASAAISAKVKKFINCSSMARYGNISAPFRETDKCNPVDPYGLAKLQAERALNLLSDIHGIDVVHIVPHNIIGTRQVYTDPYRNVVSIFINSLLLNKKLIIYGDGKQSRSFSPVNSCLDAITRVIEIPGNKQVFNIGPEGNEISIKELAEKVMLHTNIDGRIHYLPDRPREVKHAWCSNQLAKDTLDYNPQVSIDDTIKEMVQWIKNRGVFEFNYTLPVEIIDERTPKTWTAKLY